MSYNHKKEKATINNYKGLYNNKDITRGFNAIILNFKTQSVKTLVRSNLVVLVFTLDEHSCWQSY